MTYHAGMGPSMARFGIEPCRPHITCDGCGVTRDALTRTGLPCKWLMDQRAAPGWTMERIGEGLRQDYCPECSKERKAKR